MNLATAEHDESDNQQRRWPRWLLWGGLLAILLIAACSASLWIKQYFGVDRQLAAIRARGEPLTLAELRACNPPLSREQDATDLWLDAATAVQAAVRLPVASELPVVGKAALPGLPGSEWPEAGLVRKFLADNANALQLMHQAAERGGRARFTNMVIEAPNSPMPLAVNDELLRSILSCARMLRLEAIACAYDRDARGTADAIRTGLLLSRALEAEPMTVTQLVRVATFTIAVEELKRTLPTTDFSDEDLRALQQTLGKLEFKSAVKSTLIGNRVEALASFEQLTGSSGGRRLLGSIVHGADEETFLEIMADYIAEADKPWPAVLAAPNDLMRRAAMRRAPLTNLSLPSIQMTVMAFARADTARQLMTISIALERYRRDFGHPAPNLDALVPAYLAEVPDDPTSGSPFTYTASDASYVLYSPSQQFAASEEGLDAETGANPLLLFRWPPRPAESRATDSEKPEDEADAANAAPK